MFPVLIIRDVAQPGSALVWGASGRGFKSRHPDHKKDRPLRAIFLWSGLAGE